MLCGVTPFFGDTEMVILRKIKKGDFDFWPAELWKEISEDAKSLIPLMLTVKPSKRVSAEQVALHPWLNLKENTESVDDENKGAFHKTLLENLRNFKKANRLKRAAMQVIAQN